MPIQFFRHVTHCHRRLPDGIKSGIKQSIYQPGLAPNPLPSVSAPTRIEPSLGAGGSLAATLLVHSVVLFKHLHSSSLLLQPPRTPINSHHNAPRHWHGAYECAPPEPAPTVEFFFPASFAFRPRANLYLSCRLATSPSHAFIQLRLQPVSQA